MELITRDSSTYDVERALHNGMIDKRPRVIAKCATAADVIDALAMARRDRLDVAVRAGGHSVAGMSSVEDGLVIDVRPMKSITIDPAAMTATVGAGVTWGEFDAAAQEHGLATTGGRVTTTGVAGFTLGGGSGWIERMYGLACDNLLAVDLVIADGREVRASEDENPDLFWALHGGGGNFGVATRLTFRLHRVGPEVLAGLLVWPGDAGFDVGRAYRDLAHAAPEPLGSGLVFLSAPPEDFIPEHLQGTTVAAVAVLWAGDVAAGEEVIRPLRDLRPAVDLVGPMPYCQFQGMLDDPPGNRNYWTADYHDSFADDAVDVFVKYGHDRPSPLDQQILLPWGGAVARVSEDATPMTNRGTAWITHPFAVWEDAADDDVNIEWARAFRRDIAAFTNGGTYLNFIGDEGEDRVRAAYGEQKYARLSRIKAEWDPDNVFRGNQNIRPA
ncbi:MAG TPA: FAD-binding oxidoreductase [Acidimicrobiales bacterium]|jgi:FAD/FMN-containing dehydrogenase|nr:FAD-binding oxidoreductase [Acidimicrobiales bacterium]